MSTLSEMVANEGFVISFSSWPPLNVFQRLGGATIRVDIPTHMVGVRRSYRGRYIVLEVAVGIAEIFYWKPEPGLFGILLAPPH